MRLVLFSAALSIPVSAGVARAATLFADDFEQGLTTAESGQTLISIGSPALNPATQINGANSVNTSAGGLGVGNGGILSKNKGTFETWLDLTAGTAGLPTNSLFAPVTIMDWEANGFSQNHIFFGLGEYAGGVNLKTILYDNSGASASDDNVSLPLGGWVHLAYTWDFTHADNLSQDYLHVYVNGVQKTIAAFESLNLTMVQNSDNVSFGTTWSRNAAKDLPKNLDRIRLYDTTIDGVYTLTDGGFTPSTSLAPVPEPTTLGLAAVGAGLLLRRRR